jgi:hypothetical protein
MTPTSRTLGFLRKLGYVVQTVERYLPHARVRQDLFGVGDVLAIRPGEIVLVQTTSGSNLSARRTKALAEPRLRTWLEAGGKFVLHGWSKKGPAGKRKLWACRAEEITLAGLLVQAAVS